MKTAELPLPQSDSANKASSHAPDSGKEPFRVYVAKKDDGAPDKETTLASTGRLQPPSDNGNAKDGKEDGKKDEDYYRYRIFGDYMYLRARDAEVAFAVEANSGVGPPPVQVSPIAVLDQDPSSGFRVGFGVCLDECSELVASYTLFETATTNTIVSTPGNQIASMVIHPATPNAVIGTYAAIGRHDIDYDLIDLDYRRAWWNDDLSNLNWILGVRWGSLEQNFDSVFTDSLTPPVTQEVTVLTDVDFSGAGIRFGVEGERYATRWPLMVYAKAFGSLMAGEFDASYRQTHLGGVTFVDTNWEAGRIVPTFDLELGGGFYCCNGTTRATIGYVYSAWTNVVKTDDFIHAVQTNDFRDMNDNMTFDGLVVRVEVRF